MEKTTATGCDTPAFKLLGPVRRVVVGLVAAMLTAVAGYAVFVPFSDARAVQMARRNDAGSSGYAGGSERLALGRRQGGNPAVASTHPADGSVHGQTASIVGQSAKSL